MSVIDPSRDYEGVKHAAGELLLEGLAEHYLQTVVRRLGQAYLDQLLAEYETRRSLAAGYYDWAAHLSHIADQIRLGLPPKGLAWSETEGLIALEAARAAFKLEHPPCSHCGTPLFSRHARICQICNRSLEEQN
jgi:hypothetical protein